MQGKFAAAKNPKNRPSLSLAQLRKICNKTQTFMARALNTEQGNISKLESRSDMCLSTLTEYARALNIDFRLVATIGSEEYDIVIDKTALEATK